MRFGLQVTDATSADELMAVARRAEDAGFDVIHTWDHVVGGADGWAPLAPLLAMAGATSQLRVGPLVLNNDFHHPVHLAREVAAIDHVTGGRVELGIGAGHAFPEYKSIGAPFDPPKVRKARLAEAVVILRRLLDGEEVTFDGEHYHLESVQTMRAAQDHLPILVGVNGKTALAHAAQHADIIGLTMLGQTLDDGHRHRVNWQADRIDETIEHIGMCAAERWSRIELNALVQSVVVTEDRAGAAASFARRVPGLSIDDALIAPFLAIGTPREIADHLMRSNERWSISYYSVRDLDAFAPVIELLR